jgi:hypothetical protein
MHVGFPGSPSLAKIDVMFSTASSASTSTSAIAALLLPCAISAGISRSRRVSSSSRQLRVAL